RRPRLTNSLLLIVIAISSFLYSSLLTPNSSLLTFHCFYIVIASPVRGEAISILLALLLVIASD
ncbi:MAG: hypothetical protein U9O50_08330, partial [Acidobacteriota bacterium]|nr:hypothetical protein [Acidobacteriota bacterium]